MSIRPLVFWPDPRLSQVCAPARSEGRDHLATDLFETLYAAKGRGLAAPQIGVMERVFVVDVAWKEGEPDPRVFFDPVLHEVSDEVEVADELCLSIPDLPVPVARPVTVALTWRDVDGSEKSGTASGRLARCILHELDHLNGRVILDHLGPDDRADLEARYAP